MILGIDHIGVATDDPSGVGAFMTTLGLQMSGSGQARDYLVSCDFWRHPMTPAGPAIEVVAPLAEGSAIAGRLAADGPGLYHLAFEVDDLEGELARLRGEGFVALDAAPCSGALEGMRVAFIFLRRPASLVIELVEYQGRHPRV
jgi:methylmalonyl-CoA/ethylmalonyl-CoA epimerase